MSSPIKSPTLSNGQINKTILKKQPSSEILTSKSLERSYSLCDPNKDMSPLIQKPFHQNGNKPKIQDLGRLARFRERFASKKASSVEVCGSGSGGRSLALDIPEIVLNSPEDDSIHD